MQDILDYFDALSLYCQTNYIATEYGNPYKGFYRYRITELPDGMPEGMQMDSSEYFAEIRFQGTTADASTAGHLKAFPQFIGMRMYRMVPATGDIQALRFNKDSKGHYVADPAGKFEKQYIADNKMVFTNAIESETGYTGPELPNTGGIGVLPFVMTGLAFTIIPVLLVCENRKKERRQR